MTKVNQLCCFQIEKERLESRYDFWPGDLEMTKNISQ